VVTGLLTDLSSEDRKRAQINIGCTVIRIRTPIAGRWICAASRLGARTPAGRATGRSRAGAPCTTNRPPVRVVVTPSRSSHSQIVRILVQERGRRLSDVAR
jgi:hypothetical protein